MIDINQYSNESIPVIGYVLVGITTLALTYITMVDKSSKETSEPTESALSMLPSFGSKTEEKTLEEKQEPEKEKSVESEKETEKESSLTKIGGKKKNKKHKKTIKHTDKRKSPKKSKH